MNIAKEEYNEGIFFSISKSNHRTKMKISVVAEKETKRMENKNEKEYY